MNPYTGETCWLVRAVYGLGYQNSPIEAGFIHAGQTDTIQDVSYDITFDLAAEPLANAVLNHYMETPGPFAFPTLGTVQYRSAPSVTPVAPGFFQLTIPIRRLKATS